MEKGYEHLQDLLGRSSFIEDAVYAVKNCSNQVRVYAVGGSKCGSSSCASSSKCGNSRASSVSSIKFLAPSKLEQGIE